VALVGFGLYELLLKRLGNEAEAERSIVMTLGLSLMLQNVGLAVFTGVPRTVQSSLDLASIRFAGLRIPMLEGAAGISALAAVVGLYVLLQRTDFGRSMRAFSQNREAAVILGVRLERVGRSAVALGAGLAGLAGAALGSLYTVDPVMGIPVLFKAFAIITIGGVGDVRGTTVAALMIGVFESLAGGFGSKVLQDATAFLLMLAILLLRPQGLFARSVRL
jgi:branched-chain amino acid transport system permease protein